MIFSQVRTSTIAPATKESPRSSEASIAYLKDGSLLLCWERFYTSEHGSNDGGPSTLNTVHSFDSGETWQNERVIVPCPEGSQNVYSPSFLRMQDGTLGLFYFENLHWSPSLITSLCFMKSVDEGCTWSKAVKLTDRDSFFASNDSILRLSTGRIVFATYNRPEGGHVSAWPMFSDDDGKTWTKSDAPVELPMRGSMEPIIAEKSNGTLVMVMRSQLGSMFRSQSYDGGKTWSNPQTTGLVSPESCPFIRRVPDSEAMIVVWNHSEYDMNWASHYGKRSPLTIAVTYDGALTFEDFLDIETDPFVSFTNPGVTFISNDEFIVTYWTRDYDEKWIMSGPASLKQAKIKINRTELKK